MASTARIDELKKKFDENPRRYFAPLANEFRKAGDIEQAIIICEEFLPQQPGHMSGHIVYGQALYEASRMPEARTVFETALALDPENLIALRHLGDIARGQGDHGQARTWYVRVLDADPRNEEMQALIASLEGEAPAPAAQSAADDEPVTFEFQEVPPPAIVLESRNEPASGSDSFRDTLPSGMPAVPPPVPTGAAQAGATDIIDGFSIDGFEQRPASTTVDQEHHAIAEGLESTSFTSPDEPVPAADLDTTLDSGVVSFSAPERQVETLSGLQGSGMETEETVGASASHEPLDLDEGLVLPPQGDPLAEQVHAAEAADDHADHPDNGFDVPAFEPATLPSDADFDVAEPEATHDDAPPVELPPAVIAAQGALIDAGETPAPERAYESEVESHEPVESAAQAPFVTETMAELYLSQGYREEARAVYAQLLAANPSDGRLQTLVDSLSAPATPAAASPSVRDFFARIAARRPGSRAAALTPPSDDDFAATETTEAALAEPAEGPPDQVPFSVDEAEGEAEADEHAGADAPLEAPQAEAVAETLDLEPEVEEVVLPTEEIAPAIERAAAMRTPNGSIDMLFGNRPPSRSEDSAASALAQAFGGTAEAPVLAGRPARAATAELSLDSVFRDGPARAPRTSQSFSFDQFFAGGAVASSERTPAGGNPRASGEMPALSDIPAERSPEDIEQFNSWLQGLKPK